MLGGKSGLLTNFCNLQIKILSSHTFQLSADLSMTGKKLKHSCILSLCWQPLWRFYWCNADISVTHKDVSTWAESSGKARCTLSVSLSCRAFVPLAAGRSFLALNFHAVSIFWMPPWPSLSLPGAHWHIEPKFASHITSGYSWLISLFWRENANEARQLVLSSWLGVMEGPEAYLIRGSRTLLLRQALVGGERGGCRSSRNRWQGR